MTTKLYKHEGLMLMNWTLNEDNDPNALAGQFLSNCLMNLKNSGESTGFE